MTALSDQINRGPPPLPHLYALDLEAYQLGTAQATADERADDCVISLCAEVVTTSRVQQI